MSIHRPHWLDDPLVQSVLAAFSAYPGSIRFVGGCVRDSLLEREGFDIDLATSLLPAHTMELLAASGIKAIPTGIEHGTVTAVVQGRPFEITTLRKDTACDGRHANVEYTTDWQEDAARRDFTMNALYLSPDGELFDYVGGESDLRAGRVRFIGAPEDRIREDYLRILRFFRFHAGYGKGEADAHALLACTHHADRIGTLSAERIAREMIKLLSIPHCAATIALMQHANILQEVLGFNPPQSQDMLERYDSLPEAAEPVSKLVAFVQNHPDKVRAANALAERLRLSNKQKELLSHIAGHVDGFPDSLAAQKILLRRLGKPVFRQLALSVWAAHGTDQSAALRLVTEWDIPILPVGGEDLLAIGFTTGRALGRALEALEDQWEQSEYSLSKKALLEEAKKLL